MTGLLNGLHPWATTLSAGGLVYILTVALTSGVSVFARSPEERRDARATLTVLLRRDAAEQQPPISTRR